MEGSYRQFCPVAMASEILCARWTPLVLRELIAGSSRFNDLRRGLPRMSPALLSRRLKELREAGIVERVEAAGEPGAHEYRLTEAGRQLAPVIEAIGFWGQRWVETEASLKNLDPSLLMWDIRRNVRADPPPAARTVVQFRYPELAEADRAWWLVVEPDGAVDLCVLDPGFDVDLYLVTDLRTLTAAWMGILPLAEAVADGRIRLTGDEGLARAFCGWLRLSPFAAEPKRT
jgi:DNA-binding HxlR family transcriptional regulator